VLRATYITSFEESGLARPWMLAFRADFGTSGLADPDTFEQLLQLIMSEGFLSCPDLMSVEKLSCCKVHESFLDREYKEHPPLQQHLLPPYSLGYLKGWRRAVGLLTCLCAIRDLSLESEVSHQIRVTWAHLAT